MHECIRTKSPYLQPVPDTRAIENKVSECTRQARNCSDDACQYRTDYMHAHKHGGHIDWVTAHPRNRPLIIGRGVPEHTFQLMPRSMLAQVKRRPNSDATQLASR